LRKIGVCIGWHKTLRSKHHELVSVQHSIVRDIVRAGKQLCTDKPWGTPRATHGVELCLPEARGHAIQLRRNIARAKG